VLVCPLQISANSISPLLAKVSKQTHTCSITLMRAASAEFKTPPCSIQSLLVLPVFVEAVSVPWPRQPSETLHQTRLQERNNKSTARRKNQPAAHPHRTTKKSIVIRDVRRRSIDAAPVTAAGTRVQHGGAVA